MRVTVLTIVCCLLAAASAPAVGQTLAACRAVAGEAERLACYDALDPAAAVDPASLLQTLLGDPDAIGKDYEVLGNSGEVFRMLPGRWVVAHINASRSLLTDGEDFQKGCAKAAVEIAQSSDDPYALTVTRHDPKKGSLHLRDILLSTRWRLAESTNLGTTLGWLGLKPESQGLGPARPFLMRAVSLATYLPLSPDVVLTIDSAGGEMGLMLRCPPS
jgi:hypothetical protein